MPDPKERDVMNRLGSVPLFASLGKKHIETLAKKAADLTYKPGAVIVPEGEKGIGFFLVAEGEVVVEKAGKKVATLGAGQFFGEMALVDQQPRTATVRAVTPTRCLVLSPWEFWGSVGDDPEALRTLLRETVRRLRQAAPGPVD